MVHEIKLFTGIKMNNYEEIKPQKMCIYKGVLPSGQIRFFMQMVRGCLTTLDLEYEVDGKLTLMLSPIVAPLYWSKLTSHEFSNQCLKWGKKVTEFEEDFLDDFKPLPLYLEKLDKRKDIK